MDKLMALVGLEEVKQAFLSLWAKVDVFEKQAIDHNEERYHIVLLGNPGTGKCEQRRIRTLYSRSEMLIGAITKGKPRSLRYTPTSSTR
jgi:hypothetical protein